MSAKDVERLRRARERSPFLRWTAAVLAGTALLAWVGGTVDATDLFQSRRADNLVRFLSVDAMPPAVRDAAGAEKLGALWAWARDLVASRYLSAAAATLAVAIVAAILASFAGACLAPLTARSGPGASSRPRRAVSFLARLGCVLCRAVPEYMLAFLLGALLPSAAWACILALAIHNGGILGRLYGETLENADQRAARAWHLAGAGRLVATVGALFPAVLPRFLTYFFYRLETCVRESTVLGMLGFVSLGHWIVQARAAGHYDEMLLAFGMGAIIVLSADLASWIARRAVRDAS
ncbi:Phosphate-import permease protein PhnE [Planctomycetes bacterium Poly30]|uniref:Phosphate-import permease protein PhnE n=1 Tax=Saltatorellus ferox TaxID=2528018 RepID=A0A518ETX7_9BACT|nr:Phosphate-import permease protein PhnE [Planctomycetes bacterium Poly30]